MAGYSERSLVQKLGIKEGHRVLLILAPSEYGKTLGPLPGVFSFQAATVAQAKAKSLAKSAPFDFIHCFCKEEAELEALFPVMKNLVAKDGMVWVSWLKKTKGPAAKGAKTAPEKPAANPLGENRVRELGLAAGLVDVKVCAVDESWSGLKFMFRLKDRPK